MSTLWFDLRMAARRLPRRPGFALAVILLVALGVGAGSAVFTVVQRLLLAPPPLVRSPHEIVRLVPEVSGELGAAVYTDYLHYRDHARVFSDVFGYDGVATTMQVRTEGSPTAADGRFVTGNYFRALGVPAAPGRTLAPEDDHEHAPNVVVISASMRERMFGSTGDVLGRTLTLNGHAFTVVGVAPPQFVGAAHDDVPVELWLPMWKRPLVTGRPRADLERVPGSIHAFMTTMARLAPGVTIEQAQANADVLGRQLAAAFEDARGSRVRLTHMFGMSPTRRDAVVMLTRLIGGLAVIVLLIVCANLANLMLARAVARHSETSVKLALGAGRLRLIRELGAETLLLALAGGALGLLMAVWGARGLAAFLPFPMAAPPAPDARVFGFALVLALLTAFVCATAPALVATRRAAHLSGARVSGGSAAARTALVVTQVALCFLLLAGAALFTRTLGRVHAVELGFDPQGVLAVAFDLRAHGYDETTAPIAYDQLRERMAALPGVRSVALGSIVPLSGARRTSSLEIEGRPVFPELRIVLDNNVVSPGYFRTLATPVLRGREFTAGDLSGAPLVLVVNETMAERYWPGQDAIGRRVHIGNRSWEVVGVVADTRTTGVTQPPVPMYYRPFAQAFFPRMQVYVRTAGDALQLVPAVRAAIADVDPDIVPRSIDALDRIHAGAIRTFTVNARLVGILALVALVLASMGLYAVTSYLVAQRTREIGLRMAIGAQSGDILRDVLGGALQRGIVGLVIGALATVALVPAVERFLFELSPLDPAAFLWAGLPVLTAMLLASGLPARRAARIEPVVALRAD